MAPPEPDKKPADQPKFGTLDLLQILFLVACGMGVVFYLRGPASNEWQALYRLGIAAVGLVGLTIVTALKIFRKRRP